MVVLFAHVPYGLYRQAEGKPLLNRGWTSCASSRHPNHLYAPLLAVTWSQLAPSSLLVAETKPTGLQANLHNPRPPLLTRLLTSSAFSALKAYSMTPGRASAAGMQK